MPIILRWTDAWCFFCQKHLFRPEQGHAHVCAECEAKKAKK